VRNHGLLKRRYHPLNDGPTHLPVTLSTAAKKKQNVEKAIAEWVAERVANHKRLRGGVEVLEAIPKSPSGKILRKLLRTQEAEAKKAGAKL
jgi:4-coumarate--CoA ligase